MRLPVCFIDDEACLLFPVASMIGNAPSRFENRWGRPSPSLQVERLLIYHSAQVSRLSPFVISSSIAKIAECLSRQVVCLTNMETGPSDRTCAWRCQQPGPVAEMGSNERQLSYLIG